MSSKSKTGNVSGRGRRNKNGGNQPQSKLLDSKFQPPQSKLLDFKYQQKTSVPALADLNIEPVPKNQSKLSDSKLQQKLPVTALENLNVEPLQQSKLSDKKVSRS